MAFHEKFHLFTPGPVKMPAYVLEEGAKQLRYFRTKDFSLLVLDCERLLCKSVNAPPGSRTVPLTCSGTGAMEAVVANLFGDEDRLLIVNGGTFGQRFVELARLYQVAHRELPVAPGRDLDYGTLSGSLFAESSALLINGVETSTGALFDLQALGRLAGEHRLLFVVDAIGMYLTDRLDMTAMGLDVIIVSSQKGLALPPGLALLILSPRAQESIHRRSSRVRSMYFNLASYLSNLERGQTPFTPAVALMNQLHRRLREIDAVGVETVIAKTARLAERFRRSIVGLPFRVFADRPPNSLTSLSPTNGKSARRIVSDLENDYGIYVCPNGGALEHSVFRVSHMGDIGEEDIDHLVRALGECCSRE